MTHAVRPAVATDLGAAAHVLCAAFTDYPWTRWALPHDEYTERLYETQRLYLDHALRHGMVLVDTELRAVAAFLFPDAPPPPESVQRRVGELHGDRLAALLSAPLPPTPGRAWSLEAVGVQPGHQGTGLGSAVLTAGLELIDIRFGAVSLETSDERNVRLYERLGFATTATTQIPDGPFVASMYRGARHIHHTDTLKGTHVASEHQQETP